MQKTRSKEIGHAIGFDGFMPLIREGKWNLLTNLGETDSLKKALSVAIEELPWKEQLVLSLYYDEELTVSEIGKVLGLDERKILRLYAAAILNLDHKVRV